MMKMFLSTGDHEIIEIFVLEEATEEEEVLTRDHSK